MSGRDSALLGCRDFDFLGMLLAITESVSVLFIGVDGSWNNCGV
jgi:hypothetical protein